MNIKFLNLTFEISYAFYEQLHNHNGKEIAFVGASNAGKSSAINAISTNKKIAKTSKTPGKTKLFNFFRSLENYIVDFPGYGYSKTSKKQQAEWARELPKYFEKRANLVCVVLFTDIRNPIRDSDLQMIQMLKKLKLNYLIVLTKTDKLSESGTNAKLNEVKEKFPNVSLLSIKDPKQINSLIEQINVLLSS